MSQFVSQKRVSLNAPGVKKNTLYYDQSESTVSEVESNTVIGRFEQSLTSLAFGSSSQIIIPNQDFINQCILVVTLPDLTADQTLCHGWLFGLIREINYSFGQANVSQLRLSGKSLLQTIMRECETQEKRSELLRLAGESLTAQNTRPITATIVLPLPWSSVVADNKKPFDSSILSNPVQIQITLNSNTSIYGGTDPLPTALSSASVYMRQTVLADRSNSIKMDLLNNPSMIYSYPFNHRQSPSSKFNLVSGSVNNVELTEFLESDLLNILFSVQYTVDQVKAGAIAPNPNNTLICTDIELLYNGQTVYKAPGQTARLINMLWDEGSSGAEDARIDRTVAPYTSQQVTSYFYQIPFADVKAMIYDGQFCNTGRFSSQTMVLRFTPRNYDPNDVTVHQCQADFTYIYQSVAEISNGVCNIQFS